MDREPDPTERVKLEKVLGELGVDTRDAFYRRVRYPDTGVPSHFRRWQNNLRDEPHLQRGTWRDLIDAVLELEEDAPEDAVFQASVRVFRSLLAGEPLTGPEARIPPHRCLGRVVPRTTFQSYLRDKAQPLLSRLRSVGRAGRGFGGGKKAAREFVTQLMKREVLEYPDFMLDVQLHNFLMWSTFSEDRHPFAGFPTRRRSLCCVLGLLDLNCELVQLVYDLPGERTAHIPTIAEAYAGGSWDVLFQPSHSGATAGRTIPRTDCGEERTRPEVVHRPVCLRHLNARMTIL